MKVWVYLWRLFRFRPWLYVLSSLLSIAYSALPLAVGLIMRAFFNALAGDAEVGIDPWTLVALYLATTVGMQVSMQAYTAVNVFFYYLVGTLLRKNIIQSNLKDPSPRRITVPARSSIASKKMSTNLWSRYGIRSDWRGTWHLPSLPSV